MNHDEMKAIFGMLSVEYRNERIEPKRIELWTKLFEDVDFDDMQAAIVTWFQEGTNAQFFPRPSQLRALVRATQPKLDSQLYGRYAVLRRKVQDGTLTRAEDAELDRVEARLGIAGVVKRVPQLDELEARRQGRG